MSCGCYTRLMDTTKKERLVRLVTFEADILIEMIKQGIWKQFSTNYLREAVRCKYGEAFTNTVSPIVYAEVLRRRPDLKDWMDVK